MTALLTVVCASVHGQNDEQKPPLMMIIDVPPTPASFEPTPWSMEYAQQLLEKCAHIPHGVLNDDIYREIVTQKDRGDPNATYAYATLLLDYSIGNRTNTYNPNGRQEGFQLMWELAQKNHPYACEYIAATDISDLNKYIEIDGQPLLEALLRCSKIAAEHGLNNHPLYANILLFQLRKDKAGRLLLTDSTELNNKELVQAAVQNYSQCAFDNGRSYCLGRMAEAYYHGIGVEKNLYAATAWARLIADRVHYYDGYPSVDFAKKFEQEMSGNWEIYKAKETEALYEELKNKIPSSDF